MSGEFKPLEAKVADSYIVEGDIITASAEAHTGRWNAIQIIVADFPDNATNFIQNGTGKNLSHLNVLPDGSGLMFFGDWQKLHIPEANDSVIIAYRSR
jgi:hypothetical protein